MSINPLNAISKVYLEQVAAVEEGVRPTPVDKPLDKAAFKKRRRSLAGKEKSAEARKRGHKGKEWYNSGRTYSPDEAKRMRSKLDDEERRTRHRSAVDPDDDNDNNYSADKTKNPKKIRKQKAMGELGESSHLETDMKKRREKNEKAVEDMKKTAAYKSMSAIAAKKFDEAMDPVGKEDEDIDNDGDVDKSDKYLHKRRKAIGKAIAGKKGVKEDFSNWREELDLFEITDKKSEKRITEKKVNNKITINPKLGEAVEEIGGILLEMVELDEVDFVVESVYDELLEEGYQEDDIEDAIEYALAEATVTFGHDTPTGQKKKGNLVAAVGRLARQKLSSKVRGAKSAAKRAVASGARKVAKGALGVARKMEGGDKKPATAARKPSTYRGAGAGQKEKVSSGSYTPPAKKKAEKPADPWKGSATVPQKPKPKPTQKVKPSDPWRGSETVPPKPKSKPTTATKKTAAPKAKAPATAAPKRKKKSKLDSLLADIRSEQLQINEKTLTSAETKKKEEIVKSMKKSAGDFEKRYPGRGKEVMYATATKMAKKVAEQMSNIEPTTSLSTSPVSNKMDKKKEMMDRQRLANLKTLQQKKQQLERQRLQLQKSGKLPLEAN